MRAIILLVGLGTLGLLGGLGYWVASSETRGWDFPIPLDPTRALPQGGFYVGNFPSIEHLNPFTTADPVALSFVLRFTHDCLMCRDVDTGMLEPALARVIESSPDQVTHTFQLIENVCFSDGRPVTVEDVRFTFDVANDESVLPGDIHQTVTKIASFTAIDDHRFKIVLSERRFDALSRMATDYRVLQKQWFMDQIAVAARKLGREIPAGPGSAGFGELLNEIRLPGPGTGPYQLARDAQNQPFWREKRDLWLVQNLESWQRRAFPRRWNLAGFGLRFDEGSPLTQLKRQQIDWHLPMNPKELLAANPELEKTYALHVYDPAGAGHYAIMWNCERVDAEVRMALAMLVDREFIRADILGGSATLIDSWFRASDPEYPKDPRPIPFDVKAARARLAKLGYGPGGKRLEIRIITATGSERNRRMLQVLQEACSDAGVTLRADLMEMAAVLGEIEKKTDRQFDGALAYWGRSPGSIDPYIIFHSKGSLNDGHYANPKVDALLERARATLDLDERVKLYAEFHQIVQDEQPVTLLVHPINTLLLHRRFKNVKMGWGGAVPADWVVEEGDRIYYTGRPR